MRNFFISSSSASVMFQGSSMPPTKYAAVVSISELSHHVILPLYRSSHRSPQDWSVGSTLSDRYRGAANPQSTGTKYWAPSNLPCGMNAGFTWLKFEIRDVSHGCRTGLPSALLSLVRSGQISWHG